jgi:hypothetical protein
MREYRDYFYERHREILSGGDPFYNRNLTKTGLSYEVDVPLFWEESGVKNDPVLGSQDVLKIINAKEDLRYNIDSAGYRLSDAYLNEDFFEVSGWVFLKNRDVKKYTPGVMISQPGKMVIYAADRVYRGDVKKAFPKQKNACMSGFYTRIAQNSLYREGMNGDLNIAPVLISGNGKVYIGE